MAERRREVAGRDDADHLAGDEDRAVGTRRAPPVDGDADEVTANAPGLLGGERDPPAEVGLAPGDDPAETGLQRRDAGTELVAVQRQTRLEPQGVARAEAGRLHPCGDDRLPQRRRGVRRRGDLDAGLAGVAGAGDGARHSPPLRVADTEAPDRRRPAARSSPAVACACGPWTASTTRSWVVSAPPTAATTRSVLEALGITSNRDDPPSSSGCHHTMMSSSTDASSASRRWVYWARPGPILPRSLVSCCCSVVEGRGAIDPDGAEVRHVEHDGITTTGEVLGDRSGRVLERHLPATEGHHAGAELTMDCVERRALERHTACWCRLSSAVSAGSDRIPASTPALTPASGRMLSTPWPRLISSISSSFVDSTTDEVPLMTMLAELMSVPTLLAQVLEHVAHRFELDPGVEQRLDDAQLEQVAIAVPAPAAAARRLGDRRLEQTGARPVVELAVGDADDLRRLRAAVSGFVDRSHRLLLPAPGRVPHRVVTTV